MVTADTNTATRRRAMVLVALIGLVGGLAVVSFGVGPVKLSPATVIDALLPRLHHREDRAFLETAQAGMRDWAELMRERGTRQDKPMKPQVVAHELNKLLSDDAIVATDSGTITTWAARTRSPSSRVRR